MRLRSRAFRLLLAALLLFSQQQAVLHLLGHGLAQLQAQAQSPTPQESGDPQELVCAKCLALAHLDHALSGEVPTFAPMAPTPERVASVPVVEADLAFVASYRSRAPPSLS